MSIQFGKHFSSKKQPTYPPPVHQALYPLLDRAWGMLDIPVLLMAALEDPFFGENKHADLTVRPEQLVPCRNSASI